MVKIPVKTTQLPIEIGEHTFFIDTSEKGQDAFLKLVSDHAKRTAKISEKLRNGLIKQDTADKNCNKELEKTLDRLLGDGAYDKLYALSPYNYFIAEYYTEICIAVSEEIGSRDTRIFEKINRYIEG